VPDKIRKQEKGIRQNMYSCDLKTLYWLKEYPEDIRGIVIDEEIYSLEGEA
jgi:hypothetical protein